MLSAIVEEMGHGYESILNDVIEEGRETEVVETAANHQTASAIEENDKGGQKLESDEDQKNDENNKDERQDWCDESFDVRVYHSIGQFNKLCSTVP